MTPKERIYATLQGKSKDRVPVTPIFMMWAAQQIGRAYRDYYLDGSVMAQSQIAAARLLQTDQVSSISDPWREAQAFGIALDYPPDGVGIPVNGPLLKERSDIARLRLPRLEDAASVRMRDRIEAVRILAQQMGQTHSVLGWVEGPLAMYVDLRGMEDALIDLMEEPALFHQAAELFVQNAVQFARPQVQAGADMIGVGDAAASVIGRELYHQHVEPWEKRLFEAIHQMGATVKLHICGNITPIVADMAQTGADVIDVDWMVPLDYARKQVGEQITLCGNFDPTAVLLQSDPAHIAQAARTCLKQGGERFMLMPGCEVPPGTPLAHVQAFCPGEGSLIRADL